MSSTWSKPTGSEVYVFISLSVSFASWLPCCCFCCLVTRNQTVVITFYLMSSSPDDKLTASAWAGGCPAPFPAEKRPSAAQRLAKDNRVNKVKHESHIYILLGGLMQPFFFFKACAIYLSASGHHPKKYKVWFSWFASQPVTRISLT